MSDEPRAKRPGAPEPAATSRAPGLPRRGLAPGPSVLAGFAFGLSVYLAFAPVGLWPMTVVSAMVLAWAACSGSGKPARTALAFGLGSLPCWFSEQFWLVSVTPVGYPLLALYHGAFTGVTVYLLATIRRTGWRVPLALAVPLAWLATEFLRGEIFLSGYAWFLLAHPLIDVPLLAAPAGVFGAYFVSFLAAAAVGACADLLRWSMMPRRAGVIALIGIGVVWLVTSQVASRVTPGRVGPIRIGIVQTNVPQGQKLNWTAERIASDFRRFIELTRALADAQPRPDLIVWPETMFPGVSLNDRAVEAFEAVFRANNPRHGVDDRSLNGAMVQILRDTQREIGIPMFIGSKEIIGARMTRDADGRAELDDDARYNSVVIIDGGRVLEDRYDKIELTPCGEFIPVAWRWPSFQRLVLAVGAGGMKFDLSVGTRTAPLPIPGVRDADGLPVTAATPVCFEVTRSELCRRLGRDAQLLINLSNDGWFGDYTQAPVPSDAGRAQHLLAARWRCVELRRPMVRSVNTGLCAAVDIRGRLMPLRAVVAPARPTRADGAFIATVELVGRDRTIFSRIGNVFGWVAMLAGWTLFTAAWLNGRHGKRRSSVR